MVINLSGIYICSNKQIILNSDRFLEIRQIYVINNNNPILYYFLKIYFYPLNQGFQFIFI